VNKNLTFYLSLRKSSPNKKIKHLFSSVNQAEKISFCPKRKYSKKKKKEKRNKENIFLIAGGK
jgi:hypothetical protein